MCSNQIEYICTVKQGLKIILLLNLADIFRDYSDLNNYLISMSAVLL